jgi:hypothetical protein
LKATCQLDVRPIKGYVLRSVLFYLEVWFQKNQGQLPEAESKMALPIFMHISIRNRQAPDYLKLRTCR